MPTLSLNREEDGVHVKHEDGHVEAFFALPTLPDPLDRAMLAFNRSEAARLRHRARIFRRRFLIGFGILAIAAWALGAWIEAWR